MGRERSIQDVQLQARGCPLGAPLRTFATWAEKFRQQGYEPIPVDPATKKPAVEGWNTLSISEVQVEQWTREFPRHSIGLRTGHLVAIDIDHLDPEVAHNVQALAELRLGQTLVRIGRWPKRLLIYRSDRPFAKMAFRKIEVLAQGQQFVAMGIHPGTQKPYYWPGESPVEVDFADLPNVDEAGLTGFLAELAAIVPEGPAGSRPSNRAGITTGNEPTRDANGVVIEGRDGWLSTIAFHAVHDVLDRGDKSDEGAIAETVWDRFAESTELLRPKQDGRSHYAYVDALRKVRDKLRLHTDGRLPDRRRAELIALANEHTTPWPCLPPAAEARSQLDIALTEACTAIECWHANPDGPAPRIGIRATVGLGKSAVTRSRAYALAAKLKADDKPYRILFLTPSHALADESADEWRALGAVAEVHRGYEAKDPSSRHKMCRDVELVRMTLQAGLAVFPNACLQRKGSKCPAFDLCGKQVNLRAVEKADVVLASYDVLFTGLPTDLKQVGLVIIDEGFWQRAFEQTSALRVETLHYEAEQLGRLTEETPQSEAVMTWLAAFYARVKRVLASFGEGPLTREALVASGVTPEDCAKAAVSEILLRPEPQVYPGLPQSRRERVKRITTELERSRIREQLCLEMERILKGDTETTGRIRIGKRDADTGLYAIHLAALLALNKTLSAKPILHLDATLRTPLAEAILPGMSITTIEAAHRHQHLRLVLGSFGKSMLCPDANANPVEQKRRANRLKECLDYVRWQALRHRDGKLLVITYLTIEPEFAAIPGVMTGHFNAIAGLDLWGDVDCLIVIGRPLPASHDLHPMSGAFFSHEPEGRYRKSGELVQMRDGTLRLVKVMRHEDGKAEVLRSAICDDEIIQAIGRGRGVNRTEANPLEVHVLADVALPLIHDEAVLWEHAMPDVVQRMLLAGVAVDSPTDAAALHPEIFDNAEQAKKVFRRAAFGGHSPIGDTYRGMSLKSARYRRSGRGRTWQTCWWIAGTADQARMMLTAAVGEMEGGDWLTISEFSVGLDDLLIGGG